MNYEKAYKEALEKAQIYRNHLIETGDDPNEIEYIFPEIVEIENEKIRKEMLSVIKHFDKNTTIYGEKHDYNKWIAWLEKQGKKDSQVILPTFTFDDILALQCCMQAMSKNDELYKKLQSIHDRLHEVYGLEKQGEYKSAWDEEDEKFVVDTINVLYRAKNQYAQTARLEECIDWLKSLKYRIKGE